MVANQNRDNDNWSEYRRLVLSELERLDSSLSKLAEAVIENERQHLEVVLTHRSDVVDKLQKLKDELNTRHNEVITVMQKQLSEQEINDIRSVKESLEILNKKLNEVQTEVSVLKAKAAFFGFLAGLAIAIITLVIRIWF